MGPWNVIHCWVHADCYNALLSVLSLPHEHTGIHYGDWCQLICNRHAPKQNLAAWGATGCPLILRTAH
jgi:hypothetical protein